MGVLKSKIVGKGSKIRTLVDPGADKRPIGYATAGNFGNHLTSYETNWIYWTG